MYAAKRVKKWNESISGFRQLLCTYRLNWATRTSWWWWAKWDDTTLQRGILNSNPGGLRPSTLPLGHGGSPHYWVLWVDGKKHFCFFQTAQTGERTPSSSVKGSGANHYPRAPAQNLVAQVYCRSHIVGFTLMSRLILNRLSWNFTSTIFEWGRLSSPTGHWSYGSLALRVIGPTSQWSYV